uniref:Uncharacterized protein n=1 Tax=Ditylenchus dipsaci TaxID=166011 RepID=A0A915EL82_9BILA
MIVFRLANCLSRRRIGMSIVLTQVAAMNNKFGSSASFPSSPSSSAVVRARYEADVRGVNRYRHFHSPVAVQSEYAAGSGIGMGGESIDKRSNSKSPRIRRDLPSIDVKLTMSDFEQIDLDGNASFAGSPMPQMEQKTIQFMEQDEENEINSDCSKIRPHNNRSSDTETKIKFNNNPPVDTWRIRRRRRPSSPSDVNSMADVPADVPEYYGARKLYPGIKWNQPTRKKKDHKCRGNHSSKLKVKTKTAEFGTQTDIDDSGSRSSLLRSQGSSSSTDLSIPNADRTPKATQTEQLGFFSKVTSICTENNSDMEQRSELLEIIDSALEETIDRHSRQLANQFIASSARKQAQVWKDAKEFVSTMLLPCSIELANRARHCSAKMPYEKVASIQLP